MTLGNTGSANQDSIMVVPHVCWIDLSVLSTLVEAIPRCCCSSVSYCRLPLVESRSVTVGPPLRVSASQFLSLNTDPKKHECSDVLLLL